jgi:16S rRNA (adenine1518-N6/adenine1519-N6)-dimethyltransferase
LGSLTVALAATGATVLAIEFDRRLVPALKEVVADLAGVRVRAADAMKIDWPQTLGSERWTMAANLPYNIAVPLVLEILEYAPGVERFVVMVQREVGERLVAGPGQEAYGAVSVRVAYRASARIVRRVPPTVFWPMPTVDSVLVRMDRLAAPAVDADPERLWAVIEAGFEQRRKTMRNALRRVGLEPEHADAVLARCGVKPHARAESLSLAEFGRIAQELDD